MQIIIDTREQNPYSFEDYPVDTGISMLQSGDYSVVGFADTVAIERKELGDLIGCLTRDRSRFIRELERLRGYESAALLIEAPLSQIRAGEYRSKMNPEAAEQSLVSIMQKFRLPIYFAENRAEGEKFVYDYLRHFIRHATEKYLSLSRQIP